MGFYNIVNAPSLQAGQPEDISQVLANLQAIAAVLNGGVDNSNINAGAAIVRSKLDFGAGIKNTDLVSSSGVLADMPPGRELTYNEFTTSVTISATSDATATTIVTASPFTFDGVTPVLVEFYCPYMRPPTAPASMQVNLWDGSTDLGRIAHFNPPAAAAMDVPARVVRRLTPSSGSHTFSIRAWCITGTGSANVNAGGVATDLPGYIRIVKA
jgi:hypothetical protein